MPRTSQVTHAAHLPLCPLELLAERQAMRCPGEECVLWDDGCVLARVEAELEGRPELAALLLTLRRQLERLAVDDRPAPGAGPSPTSS